jgi:hypothetical protein
LCKCSDDVILALLAANNGAAMISDRDGDLPLHQAIKSKCSDEVILALLAANNGSTMISDPCGDLPLHLAFKSKCSEQVARSLFVANKEAAVMESSKGEHPLHLALKNKYSDTLILEIFAAYPSAAMIRCKVTGMLPLHLAAASSASPKLVESMIKEYPEALDIVANHATPRDLVTAALPVESMKMICRPNLHWKTLLSTHLLESTKEAAEKAEALRQLSTDVATISQILEGVCKNLVNVSEKVNAVQNRLEATSVKRSIEVDEVKTYQGPSPGKNDMSNIKVEVCTNVRNLDEVDVIQLDIGKFNLIF